MIHRVRLMAAAAALLIAISGCSGVVSGAQDEVEPGDDQAPLILMPCGGGILEAEAGASGFRYVEDVHSGSALAVECGGHLLQLDAAVLQPRCLAVVYRDAAKEFVVTVTDFAGGVARSTDITSRPEVQNSLVMAEMSDDGQWVLVAEVQGSHLVALTRYATSGEVDWTLEPTLDGTFDRLSTSSDLSVVLLQVGPGSDAGEPSLRVVRNGMLEAPATVPGMVLSQVWLELDSALVVKEDRESASSVACLVPLNSPGASPTWQTEVSAAASQMAIADKSALLLSWQTDMSPDADPNEMVTTSVTLLDATGVVLWEDSYRDRLPYGWAMSPDGLQVAVWPQGATSGEGVVYRAGDDSLAKIADVSSATFDRTGEFIIKNSAGLRTMDLR